MVDNVVLISDLECLAHLLCDWAGSPAFCSCPVFCVLEGLLSHSQWSSEVDCTSALLHVMCLDFH